MPETPATFSESWYRIAPQRLALRPGVRLRRQNFRGERWIVLENPFSNQFFRLRPAAYEFVARLRPDRTVQEVWQECLDRFPDDAPGQQAVIQLLSQLYFANLLQYDVAADAAQLFDRYKKRRQQEVRARFLNLMFMRFPLIDPDAFLVRTLPVVGRLVSPLGMILWLVAVVWAGKIAIDRFPALQQQSQSVLAPSNLLLLYLGLVLVKTLHEFGHAYVCRKFGGEVHVMGILLMIFTPVPYMDATSSWGFRSRWQRILVGAAGMIVEVFAAALATFLWRNTGEGTLHSLAYNMMFVASVSTILFNINPLLRFDGYYILSDLLDIPNLHQRAIAQLRHLAERYLFGLTQSESPTHSQREAFWLAFFGVASGIYRVFVFGAILLLIADRFLILGILMAVVCAVSWVLVPTGRFLHYLSASPRLDRHRPRAVTVSLALATGLVLFFQVVPFPNGFRAPGVLRARQRSEIITEAAGRIKSLHATSGNRVTQGALLVEMENGELDLSLANARAALAEIQARILRAAAHDTPSLQPLSSRQESVLSRIRKLEQDREALRIRARHDGVWVAPGLQDYVGRFVPRGTGLGLLVNPASFEFTATVRQEDVNDLFARNIASAHIRLHGQAGVALRASPWTVIPAEQRLLPSAALGWTGGGEIPVALDDPQGRHAAEPFFEVHAQVQPAGSAQLLDGRSGTVRFALEPEPLLPRWIRRLRQLVQKRYQWS